MTQNFEQRLVTLEKKLHIYRLSFVGFLIVIAGFMIMSFTGRKPVPDLVQAKAFQVVNDDGKVLMEMSKEDGNGQLSTYSATGSRLVSLFTSDGGAGGINTFGKDGKVLFKVTNTSEGGGYLALFNGGGTEIGEMGVTNNESGYLRLNDRNANKMIWLTYTQDGGGYLSLSKDGKETIRLSTPMAGGRLGIYNGAGTRIGYMGAQENGDGNITVWNSAGTKSGGVPAQ